MDTAPPRRLGAVQRPQGARYEPERPRVEIDRPIQERDGAGPGAWLGRWQERGGSQPRCSPIPERATPAVPPSQGRERAIATEQGRSGLPPRQGVYRSSYKNALRLTATENNMAYRTADHERWNDLDFVIGMEIKLSGNHPIEDICDEMCGVYPKTFKFVGWHPFCRCYAVPKLADEDEFIARQQALIDGEELPQGTYTAK